MREHAESSGALTVLPNPEIVGIDTAGDGVGAARPVGRVTRVRTTAGDIETETCVICFGVWSPRLARIAAARIPLTPIVHHMISVGPSSLLPGTPPEISYTLVRDVD